MIWASPFTAPRQQNSKTPITETGLFGIMAAVFLCCGSPGVAARTIEGRSNVVKVIFDTDMCIDPDDAMALAIVHALHDRREIDLVAVTVSLDEKWCAPYVDVLNTFYGRPDIPIGTTRTGPSLQSAGDKIRKGLGFPEVKQQQPRDTFAQFVLNRRNPDGSFIYPRRLVDGSQTMDATRLLRETLAAQADGSVVMIQVGNSSNFAALLDSSPDTLSNLNGADLIRKKVRLLSVMGGTFQDTKTPTGLALPKGTGINFFEDVAAAKKVVSEWPTPIVASGVEIGESIRVSNSSIELDYSYVSNHPIADSFRYICNYLNFLDAAKKCLWNHHTADPTATLYALRPDRNYFALSNAGKITVLANGNMRFDESPSGMHRYLIVDDVQRARAQEAMIMLASQPPAHRKSDGASAAASALVAPKSR